MQGGVSSCCSFPGTKGMGGGGIDPTPRAVLSLPLTRTMPKRARLLTRLAPHSSHKARSRSGGSPFGLPPPPVRVPCVTAACPLARRHQRDGDEEVRNSHSPSPFPQSPTL